MSWQSELRAWAVASAAVFCLSAVGYRVWKIPAIPDLSPTIQKANLALDTINHGCAPGPCGTLANVNKLIVKTGDIAVDVHRQVIQSGTLINAASQSLTETSQAVNEQLSHVGPLLDAGRAAVARIPATLDQANTVLANADGAVTDTRKFINAPALSGTITNVQGMTGSWAGISADARTVADKATTDYMKPVPWYLWPVKRGGQLLDIGAAVARHAP